MDLSQAWVTSPAEGDTQESGRSLVWVWAPPGTTAICQPIGSFASVLNICFLLEIQMITGEFSSHHAGYVYSRVTKVRFLQTLPRSWGGFRPTPGHCRKTSSIFYWRLIYAVHLGESECSYCSEPTFRKGFFLIREKKVICLNVVIRSI